MTTVWSCQTQLDSTWLQSNQCTRCFLQCLHDYWNHSMTTRDCSKSIDHMVTLFSVWAVTKSCDVEYKNSPSWSKNNMLLWNVEAVVCVCVCGWGGYQRFSNKPTMHLELIYKPRYKWFPWCLTNKTTPENSINYYFIKITIQRRYCTALFLYKANWNANSQLSCSFPLQQKVSN